MQQRTKRYIEPEHAKKKIERYPYWSIHDESGVLMTSSDNNEGASFSDILGQILEDPVDSEFQIRYGSNEPMSRKNRVFIVGNENIEWIEPEQQTVNINGTRHTVDKNGNVNINLSGPESPHSGVKVESARIDTVRQEMEIRLEGIQRQYELDQERMKAEMEHQKAEQLLQFRQIMLENQIKEVENERQRLADWEADLQGKQNDIQDSVKGYLKQVPAALGGLFKELVKEGSKSDNLSGAEEDSPSSEAPKERKKVQFSIVPDEPEEIDESSELEEIYPDDPEEVEPEQLEEPAPIETN